MCVEGACGCGPSDKLALCDGSCVDISQDALHCGGCGNTCEFGCRDGKCTVLDEATCASPGMQRDSLNVVFNTEPKADVLSFCGEQVGARVYRWTAERTGTAFVKIEVLSGDVVAKVSISSRFACDDSAVPDPGEICVEGDASRQSLTFFQVERGVTYTLLIGTPLGTGVGAVTIQMAQL